jgi:hypothetical protein
MTGLSADVRWRTCRYVFHVFLSSRQPQPLDNCHLSIGDSGYRGLFTLTEFDLHWVAAAFDRIDIEIEEGVVLESTGTRTRRKRLTAIGHLRSLGVVERGS